MELIKTLGPLSRTSIERGLNPTILTAIIGHALPAMGYAEVAALCSLATRVFEDLKQQSKCVTLGQIVSNPTIVEFFNRYDTSPVWRILRCPSCARIVERDTRNPSSCSCGYDWADEKADLLAYACTHATPGGLLEQFELLRKETHE